MREHASLCETIGIAVTITVLTALLASLSIGSAGAQTENEQSAATSATIGVTVDVSTEGAISWSDVGQGADNVQADTAQDNYALTVLSTTTVNTDWQTKATDLESSTPATDNVIEAPNIVIVDNQAQIDNGAYANWMAEANAYDNIDWMQDLQTPGSTDNVYPVYPSLSTATNQGAGTYSGTWYFKAIEVTAGWGGNGGVEGGG